MKVLKKICQIIIKTICFIAAKIVYRVKIEGIENVPKNSACIICGNHVHALDAPALIASTSRKIRFMAKQELWKSVGFKFMAWIFEVFPVARGQKDTEAIKTSMKILKSNEILGMYPEGTRNGIERGIKPKNGAVNLAIRMNVPIIPFGVSGSFKPFTKVVYRFGEPINFSNYKDDAKNKEIVDGLTSEVMSRVIELRDEIQC
ncbi:MAG: 1-acyl-sn-glycerol-3-phosphate acyltransferase [Clostridia bacterium]|nr:1-acyl-sn-glycerol-3-phosphate acyltransferase [Clostridia bacterium]